MSDRTIDISYPGGGKALPKQEMFHREEKARAKLFSGGYGSGKTSALVAETMLHLFNYPGNEGVIGRLTIDEITRTFLPMFFETVPSELIASHNKQDRVVRFINNSVLYYMPLDDARGAKHKIAGMNLGFALVDQLEEITKDLFTAFLGRLRRPKTRRQFFANCNPEGHNWIWHEFIRENEHTLSGRYRTFEANAWTKDVAPPSKQEIEDRAFALGKEPMDLIIGDFPNYVKYTDNQFLPLDFLLDMLSWPEQTQNRYVFGRWDAFEGLIYGDWDDDVHIVDPFDRSDKTHKMVVSMDYGKRNPTSIGFYDIDHLGRIFRVDELYHADVDIPTMKMMIRAKLGKRNPVAYVGDPSIFRETIKGQDSVARLYSNENDISGWGIHWTPANNDVNAGLEMCQQVLRHDVYTGGTPGFYVFRDKNPQFIHEIQDYRWKEMAKSTAAGRQTDQPEKPRKFKDHAMDDWRYLVMYVKRHGIKADVSNNLLNKSIRKARAALLGAGNVRKHMIA